jgi:hypothetical protein
MQKDNSTTTRFDAVPMDAAIYIARLMADGRGNSQISRALVTSHG